MSYLTRSEIENPMPPGKTLKNLQSTSCKKSKLYKRVWNILYTPRDTGIPELETFKQVSEIDVKWVKDENQKAYTKRAYWDFQPILQKLYLSLAEGKFPSDWKNAQIRLLWTLLKSYRPVSNLILGKSNRKCCIGSNECKVIPDYQSTYCANYSCLHW